MIAAVVHGWRFISGDSIKAQMEHKSKWCLRVLTLFGRLPCSTPSSVCVSCVVRVAIFYFLDFFRLIPLCLLLFGFLFFSCG